MNLFKFKLIVSKPITHLFTKMIQRGILNPFWNCHADIRICCDEHKASKFLELQIKPSQYQHQNKIMTRGKQSTLLEAQVKKYDK